MRPSDPRDPQISGVFAGSAPPPVAKAKRPSPFSIRLSDAERARLVDEAGAVQLGTYIRQKLLGGPVRVRRTGASIYDREAHAKALALLGSSRLTDNLGQLAHLASVGALPFTPETAAELNAALEDVRSIRTLLIAALGLKSGETE